MSDREYRRWMAFDAVEPFGDKRANMHAGIVASAILAPHTKRGKKPPGYRDFMLKDTATAQAERKAQTLQSLKTLKAMAVRKPKPNG